LLVFSMKHDLIQAILHNLPHRYPFLLVDRVLEIVPQKQIRAYKNVSFNEPFFMGHFPQNPIFPGVLQVEALAQAACILAFSSQEYSLDTHIVYLAGLDNVRFRRPVIPGDCLQLWVEIIAQRKGIFKLQAKASVGDEETCNATITAAIQQKGA